MAIFMLPSRQARMPGQNMSGERRERGRRSEKSGDAKEWCKPPPFKSLPNIIHYLTKTFLKRSRHTSSTLKSGQSRRESEERLDEDVVTPEKGSPGKTHDLAIKFKNKKLHENYEDEK